MYVFNCILEDKVLFMDWIKSGEYDIYYAPDEHLVI